VKATRKAAVKAASKPRKVRVPRFSVEVSPGVIHTMERLLGDGADNPKTAKNKVSTAFFAMTPHKVPGRKDLGNACPFASEGEDDLSGCTGPCLTNSGRSLGISPSSMMIHRSRLAKRVLYTFRREEFLSNLSRELRLAVKRAEEKGHQLIARLNVISDINWFAMHPEIFTSNPEIQFMDYTKNHKAYDAFRAGEYPKNYHLTFSRDGKWNEPKCLEILASGGTCTAVFHVKYSSNGSKDPLPATYLGFPVFDGDTDDMRFKDPAGHWIGLRAKGKARTDVPRVGGFVIPMPCQP
jgi:hypothetical protein